ncbi:unnamed protein product, partial [Mesorhabditis spiculigera]
MRAAIKYLPPLLRADESGPVVVAYHEIAIFCLMVIIMAVNSAGIKAFVYLRKQYSKQETCATDGDRNAIAVKP